MAKIAGAVAIIVASMSIIIQTYFPGVAVVIMDTLGFAPYIFFATFCIAFVVVGILGIPLYYLFVVRKGKSLSLLGIDTKAERTIPTLKVNINPKYFTNMSTEEIIAYFDGVRKTIVEYKRTLIELRKFEGNKPRD